MAAIRAMTVERPEFYPQALASARRRVAAYLASGVRDEPRVEELLEVVAAPGEDKATVKLNLAAMTLRDWSRRAYGGLVAGTSDPWFGLAALAALGFRPLLGDGEGGGAAPPEKAEPAGGGNWRTVVAALQKFFDVLRQKPLDVEGLPGGEPPPGSRAVMVVRRAAGSLTEGWMPSPTLAAVALTASEAGSLLGRLPRRDFRAPGLGPPLVVVAFEMPLDEKGADQELLKQFRARVPGGDAEVRVLYLYLEQPTEQVKGRYVSAPRGLGDLVDEQAPAAAR
jgi:hypothetical protein